MDTEILYQCVSISMTVTVDITDITLSATANNKLTSLETMQTKDTNYTYHSDTSVTHQFWCKADTSNMCRHGCIASMFSLTRAIFMRTDLSRVNQTQCGGVWGASPAIHRLIISS